jgi:LruC domain-containing protein
MNPKFTSFIFLLFIFLISSCKKNEVEVPVDPNPTNKSMEDLVISPSFKFKNTKTVNVSVDLPFTVDYSAIKGKIDFYFVQNNIKHIVHTGLSDHHGKYTGSFEVPAHLNEIIAHSIGGDILVSLNSGLKSTSDGGVYVNFGNTLDTVPPPIPTSLKLSGDQTMEAPVKGNLPENFKQSTTSNNLLSNGDFSLNQFGSISHWDSPIAQDGKWYITSEIAGKAIQYNDGGNHVLRIASSVYKYGGVAQMITASSGQLITLSGNIKVSGSGTKYAWLYLIPRNSAGQAIAFYAVEANYLSSSWGFYQIAATMPAGTANCEALIWINNYGGYLYYDNIVATGPNPDADNDGVIDAEDEFPGDGSRAFTQYYPSSSGFATLAFEDNWPYKADYDFNDLVIALQHKMILNSAYELVELYSKFSIRAIGASFNNAFGFEMNMAPGTVGSVTGNSLTEGYLHFAGNNTESGQSKAVIIVTDNVFKQLHHPGSGTGVNTTPGAPYVTPDTLEIHVTMNTPVSISAIGSAPFNPFIIVNQNRGREIHLIDHAPTSLADPSIFGTGADNSNSGTGAWYKTSNNLPWCIELPAQFDYPVEKSAIIDGFLNFGAWAESSGANYPDWYLPGIPGYRDDQYIY